MCSSSGGSGVCVCSCTGQVQRCGVSAVCVSTVDVVVCAQFLHSGQAALLCRVQQGGVTLQQVLDVRVGVLHQIQRSVAVPVLLGWISTMLEAGNNPVRDFIWRKSSAVCVCVFVPAAAVYRCRICPWWQLHAAVWTSRGRPCWPRHREEPTTLQPHSDRRNRRYGAEPDLWERDGQSVLRCCVIIITPTEGVYRGGAKWLFVSSEQKEKQKKLR